MTALKGDDALRKRLRAIGDTRKLLGTVALLGVSEAKKIARKDFTKTANLERSIRLGTVTDKTAQIVAGGTSGVGYARYVEEGTGLYGPRKRKIVPKTQRTRFSGPFLRGQKGQNRGGVLAWKGGGSRLTGRGPGASWRYARSVRGRKATPYLVPGAKKAIERSGVADAITAAWNDAA